MGNCRSLTLAAQSRADSLSRTHQHAVREGTSYFRYSTLVLSWRVVLHGSRLHTETGFEFRLKFWMGDFDQRLGALSKRLAVQVCDAIFRHHIVHVATRRDDARAALQRRHDARA